MTAKEYLRQAYLLDRFIESNIKTLEDLKLMRTTIQGCSYDERVGSNPNRNIEAPFIRTIEKIWELEDEINEQICQQVSLHREINEAIDQLEDPAERLVLKYRYLNGMEWENIAREMSVSYRTVHRINASALKNFKVPEEK